MQDQNFKYLVSAFKGLAKLFLPTLYMILTPISYAQGANLCAHLFSKEIQRPQNSISLSQFIHERYFTKEQTLSVHDFDGQAANMISQFYYPLQAQVGHTVQTVRLGKKNIGTVGPLTTEPFQDLVKQSIEFVLESYAERRIWSAEFRDHLYEQAIQDSGRSTYIVFQVFDPSNIRDVLKGTLKIIEASSDRKDELPVDTNLGIHLPFNGGLKFELGNFAIDKNYNKEAFSEILIQLMMHARQVSERKHHVQGQMIYFTYADAFSYRMYRSLGFTPVPGFEKPIEKDGTKWTPMGISAEGILRIPETMQSSRSYWEPQVLKELLDIFAKLDTYKKQKLLTSSWTFPNYWLLLKRSEEKSIQGVYQYRELVIQQPNFGEIVAKIKIPFQFLPMKENSSIMSANGVYKLMYLNGILKIEINDINLKQTIQIKADPNFNAVESIEKLM